MTKIKKEEGPSISPLGERVLVLPDKKEDGVTASGIILPGTEENMTGVVMGVGPGKALENGEGFIPVGVTYGDRVLIGKFGWEEVMFDGVKYYIVPESSLLAIIN